MWALGYVVCVCHVDDAGVCACVCMFYVCHVDGTDVCSVVCVFCVCYVDGVVCACTHFVWYCSQTDVS